MKYFGNVSAIRIFVKIFTDAQGNLKKIYEVGLKETLNDIQKNSRCWEEVNNSLGFKYVVKIQYKTLAKNCIYLKKFISRKCDTKYLEKIVHNLAQNDL